MKKLLAIFSLLLLWPAIAFDQSSPGLYQGFVPTAGQWNSYFTAKQDYSAVFNANLLNGATFAAPGAIGGTTAGSGAFTTVSASGKISANGGLVRAITTQTGATYTVAATDTHVIANRAGTVTLTLPAASSNTGREFTVRTIQAQTVVSATSNVVPCVGGSAGTAILAATAGKWATLVSDGTNYQIQMCN